MLVLGGKKKKILNLAAQYAKSKDFNWETYYADMGKLLKR